MYLTANEFLARIGGIDALCAKYGLDRRSGRDDVQDAVDAALNVEGVNLQGGDIMTAETVGDVERTLMDHLRPPARVTARPGVKCAVACATIGNLGRPDDWSGWLVDAA